MLPSSPEKPGELEDAALELATLDEIALLDESELLEVLTLLEDEDVCEDKELLITLELLLDENSLELIAELLLAEVVLATDELEIPVGKLLLERLVDDLEERLDRLELDRGGETALLDDALLSAELTDDTEEFKLLVIDDTLVFELDKVDETECTTFTPLLDDTALSLSVGAPPQATSQCVRQPRLNSLSVDNLNSVIFFYLYWYCGSASIPWLMYSSMTV